ncbi:cytochrome C oxidase subunit II [Cohnella endophytica]|uniref:Cytochrome C oxidase subunit II n=1 Tax=Cohnella endophytica TaxID=2419778 RepID=A0A494XTC4_9BACL|nr:cupredoxin domain-containing protein [Cohnella endophytica]RKP53891.1 cytochrome C oxidase subunit II [Cohnella endophytica]
MKLRTSIFFTIVALAAMLALTACGSNNSKNNNSSPAASAPAASEGAEGGQTIEATIDASNWKFDVTEVKAKVGDTLKLTMKSSEGNHGILIEDLGGVKIKNGETVEIKLDKAGTFEYHCNIMCGQGHDNMTGNIIVE